MILDRIFGKRASSENPANPITDDDDPFGPESPTQVNRNNAHAYSAMWKGLNLLSAYVGKLPCKVNKREDDAWTVDRAHPAYPLVHRKANIRMTAKTFRQVLTKHAVLDGNGYAAIIRDNAARPMELWPLPPEATYPIIVGDENGKRFQLEYYTTVRGQSFRLQPSEVLHIKGMSDDGIQGLNMLAYGGESIGLGLDTQGFARMYFKNGLQPSGVLMYPRKLKQQAIDNLRASIERAHSGLNRAFRLVILEEGAKLEQSIFDNEKAQFLQTREFQLRDVANFLMMPPHKLGDQTRQAYASLEQENQSFLDESLDPWLVEWEGEYQEKLLSRQEQESESHNVRFTRNAVVQTDIKSRFDAYQVATQSGWMSPNEVRAREEMNPRPGGDAFFVPLNMGMVGEDGVFVPVTGDVTTEEDVDSEPAPTDQGDADNLRDAHRELIAWALCRGFLRTMNRAKQLLRVNTRLTDRAGQTKQEIEKAQAFVAWLDEDKIGGDCREAVVGYLAPSLAAARSASVTGGDEYAVADLLLAKIRNDLLQLIETCTPADLFERVTGYTGESQLTLPAQLAGEVVPTPET